MSGSTEKGRGVRWSLTVLDTALILIGLVLVAAVLIVGLA